MHAFDFILVLFSFVFVCRDLVASRRRQHIVFGRRRLKLAAMNRIAKLVGLAGARRFRMGSVWGCLEVCSILRTSLKACVKRGKRFE